MASTRILSIIQTSVLPVVDTGNASSSSLLSTEVPLVTSVTFKESLMGSLHRSLLQEGAALSAIKQGSSLSERCLSWSSSAPSGRELPLAP